MKTIMLEMANGHFKKIEVPDEATFTFGAIVPGSKSYSVDGGWAIRVKMGKDQVAVITNVKNVWISDLVKLSQSIDPAGNDVMDNWGIPMKPAMSPDAFEEIPL